MSLRYKLETILLEPFQVFWERLCRIGAWLPVIWKDRDFDWDYIYQMLDFKLQRLAKCLEQGYGVKGGKRGREARIAAALCRRIVKDDYLFSEPPIGPWNHVSPFRRKLAFPEYERRWYSDYMLKQDLRYLHEYLTKNVRSWWD